MAFEVISLDDQHEFAIAHLGNSFADDPPDVSQGSFLWLFLKTLAAAVTDNHAHQSAIQTDLLPDTALDDKLIEWGEVRGVYRKGATAAAGARSLRVFGNSLTVVPLASVLEHASGLTYQVTRADAVGPGGIVDVDVAALSVGAATMLGANETLTFTAPIAGLQDDARIVKALQSGDDQESLGALRGRILSRWKDPPRGGTSVDYVQWALTVAGIATGYAYPLRAGYGSMDLVALHAGSGSARIPTGPELAVVQAALDVLRPVTVRAFRVLAVTPLFVDVEYAIEPDGDSEHVFDWDDTTPPTVAAYDGTTRTLTFSARPPDLLPGGRLTLKSATPGTGAQRVVEAFGAGANDVILEFDAAGDVPNVTDVVYAGGALVDGVRAAVQALGDELGPANPDAHRYGPWEGNLRPGAVDREGGAVDGVLFGTVVAPGATVIAADPAFPDDGSVELICLRRIIVRKAH